MNSRQSRRLQGWSPYVDQHQLLHLPNNEICASFVGAVPYRHTMEIASAGKNVQVTQNAASNECWDYIINGGEGIEC